MSGGVNSLELVGALSEALLETPSYALAAEHLNDAVYGELRLSQTHDLWHVVTGFDTTVVGEIGLQAFHLTQFPYPLASALTAQLPPWWRRSEWTSSYVRSPSGWCGHERIPAAAAVAPAGGLAQGLREGIAFAWVHGAIRTGLLLIAMINLPVLGPVVIGVVELVTLRFGGGGATFGWLQAAYGVGALVGVWWAGRFGAIAHPGGALGWLSAGLGAGLLGLAVAGQWWTAAALLAAMGIGGGLVGVLATAWLQRETPAPLQGRVMALAMLAGVAFDPLSQALSGVLIDISLPGLFLIAGGSLLLTVPFALRPAQCAGVRPPWAGSLGGT